MARANMASFCFLISILMLSTAWAAQNFVPVSVCPRDLYTWNLESGKKNCQGDTPDYLCAAIENQVGKFGEICTKFGLTPANKCAVLNEQTHNLDSVDCKADSGCPAQPYIPSVLWQYQICYKDFYGTTTSPAPITTPNITSTAASSGTEDGGSGSGAGVAVAVILIILIIFVVVMVVFYVRNQFGFRDKVQQLYTDIRTHFPCFQQSIDTEGCQDVEKGKPSEQAQPLIQQDVEKGKPSEQAQPLIQQDVEKGKTSEQAQPLIQGIHDETKLIKLLKYLVHILKQEIDVNDLKEEAVIHSKSINEHFKELDIKDLQSVKDVNGYSQLDKSLVFALLQNFCDGIKPPSRGWDYEPPDDETHLGADIERIRFMWNKYCDNDLKFKHLDDVYNRMTQKYGTEAVYVDDSFGESPSKDAEPFELMKEKVQSIKLNPDCVVEKGIVITENITTALKILNSKNVVILKGAIGCGKTHALKAIQNHFQDKKYNVVWVESKYFQRGIADEKPTILLWDNLLGKFGCSIFSQDAVNKTEKVLKEIESSKQTKVVIGIHTHVHEEVKKSLKLNFLQQKNITVEMDNLSEAETLLIFKEQLKRGHCKTDLNCWFKKVGFQSVLDKLSKNQGHIGGPFLSLMYCNQHELFSDEAFSNNPIQTLMQHFQRMKQDSLFSCLLYLMCVQEHNCDKEPEKWAGLIDADVTKHKLKDIATTSGYVQMESNEETLVHEILAIVLFKSAAETSEELFSPVVKRCKLDLMIQILRPVSTNNDLYCGFMDVDKKSKFREIGKIFVGRCVIDKTLDLGHPLRTSDFVQKKFKKWQEKPSKWVAEKLRMGD